MTDLYDMSHHNDVIRTVSNDKANTLSAHMGTGGDNVQLVHNYCIAGNAIERLPQNGGQGLGVQKDISYTLNTIDRHAVSMGRIRRLTPLECERLQGLPDGYTEGGSDAARYKAIGNGMAQPCADFVLRRIAECSQQ